MTEAIQIKFIDVFDFTVHLSVIYSVCSTGYSVCFKKALLYCILKYLLALKKCLFSNTSMVLNNEGKSI